MSNKGSGLSMNLVRVFSNEDIPLSLNNACSDSKINEPL